MAFKQIFTAGRKTVSQGPSFQGDVILGVEQNGDLRWYCYYGSGIEDVSGGTGWVPNSGNRIGNGWHNSRHLFGVSDGISAGYIFSVEQNGDLRWFNYVGSGIDDVSGNTGWAPNSGNRIGNGWHGFTHMIAYPIYHPDGLDAIQIFGVEQNGNLRWYGYQGNGEDDVSGNTGWHPKSGTYIGNGWNTFRFLVAGSGTHFGVAQNGDLLWYQYFGKGDGNLSGSTGWNSSSGNPIGNNWHGFKHLFASGQPGGFGGRSLYGVEQDGNLRWYRYIGRGESDVSGNTGWAPNSRNFIGRGW